MVITLQCSYICWEPGVSFTCVYDKPCRLVYLSVSDNRQPHCTCVCKRRQSSAKQQGLLHEQAAGGSPAQTCHEGDPVVCVSMRDRFTQATGDGCWDVHSKEQRALERGKVLTAERLYATLCVK